MIFRTPCYQKNSPIPLSTDIPEHKPKKKKSTPERRETCVSYCLLFDGKDKENSLYLLMHPLLALQIKQRKKHQLPPVDMLGCPGPADR
jgi:hypothetical protein